MAFCMQTMLLSVLLICLIHSTIGAPQARHPEQPPCGKSKYHDAGNYELPKPFITGGIKARPYEFPWQVIVNIWDSVFCGGSIINDRWILTAAHCIVAAQERTTLQVGDHIHTENNNPYRQTFSVEEIVEHPKNYDFCLLKTNQSIIFNENVSPICLPEANNPYIHKKAVISGYGRTSEDGPTSATLLYTTLNTTSNEDCKKLIPIMSDDKICATDNMNNTHRGGCDHDSGGPLAVKDSNGIFSLIGVVSFTRGKCAGGYPTVFARVNHVVDWITETIEK